MANFEGSLTFVDGDGEETSRTYYMVAADRAAAVAKLQGIAEAANEIIQGAIVGATLRESVDISTWTLRASPLVTADKEIQVVFTGRVTGNYSYKHSLPTFDKDQFSQAGGNVPLTNEVFAYAETGLVLNGFADYRYTDIIAIDSAKEKIG